MLQIFLRNIIYDLINVIAAVYFPPFAVVLINLSVTSANWRDILGAVFGARQGPELLGLNPRPRLGGEAGEQYTQKKHRLRFLSFSD